MKRNPVVWIMSILAALQLLAGASAFIDVIGLKWAALAMAVVLAAQFGLQFWVRGEVTPLADPRDDQGRELVPVNRRDFG
jgi:hypothetical protein